MSSLVPVLAVALAWVGAAMTVMAGGRRGRGLGLGLVGLGLGIAGLWEEEPATAVALVTGGLVAGAFRARGGLVWGLVPAGATPRVVLSVFSLVAAAFVGIHVMGGDGAPLRVAGLAAALIGGAMVLDANENRSAATGISLAALGMGAVGGPDAAFLAGAVTIIVALLPDRVGDVAA